MRVGLRGVLGFSGGYFTRAELACEVGGSAPTATCDCCHQEEVTLLQLPVPPRTKNSGGIGAAAASSSERDSLERGPREKPLRRPPNLKDQCPPDGAPYFACLAQGDRAARGRGET
ncbi:unnamed protein product [Prorocentrum cordatum]|uniref:Uncharacterized protein n=1 Tax=Prorocentrum cordatum TaxID=2364126 RepID=A0ABN9VFB4_9DINO|nr:unnamed protein product [Polarella glacialis]